ncbi:MAG: peptidylprolyl isomerase [bacterium]
MKSKQILIFAFAALFLAAPLWAKLIDDIAVVANQDSMTQGELDEAIQAYFLGQGEKTPSSKSAAYGQARQAVLNSFIEEVALADEADQEKIDVTQGEMDHAVDQQVDNMKTGYPTEAGFEKALAEQGLTVDDLRQDLRTQLTRRLKAQHMLREKQEELPQTLVISDEEAHKYYDQHKADYDQAHFAIILFRMESGAKPAYLKQVKAQAEKVLVQLRMGGDFAAAAKKYSEDQGSADKGGDVGTVDKTDLEPRLAKGVYDTPVGHMDLVQGAEGFYIIKVISRQQSDFASVASEIEDQLRKADQDQALKNWVESLKKKVYVRYSKTLAEQSASDLPYDSLNTAPPPPAHPVAQVADTASAAVPNALAPSTVASNSVSAEKAPVYSTLPEEGDTTLELAFSPWLYGTSDLSQNYGSGTSVSQGFPLGLEGDLALEVALDPELQLGACLQVINKFGATVEDKTGTRDSWGESVAGVVVGPKVLLPLTDGLNLDLYAQGGYYVLFGNEIQFSGNHSGTVYLDGSNFGGQLGADLEMFLDQEKTWALDLGVGYRGLVVNPIVKGGVTGDSLSSYQVDFSGFKSVLGLRFYLDKD